MNKIIRFFNQNRKKIFIAIAFIVFIIIIIQLLDKQAEKRLQERNIYSNSQRESKPNKSAVSGYEMSESSYATHKNIISNFIEYCNNKEIAKAYELISSDCKEELYPSLQDFKEYYYDNIFSQKRTFSMQNWNESIYIVRYTEDVLSTGKINDDSTIQDYIKVESEEGQKKLSINNFLGKTDINRESKEQNIKIKVLQKRSYMDYEIYDFEVENNTGDIIILDTLLDNKNTYLTDNNGTNHYSINNEINKDSITIKNNHKNIISIKFDNPYIANRKIKKVVFSNIVICNDNNLNGDYKKKVKISVDI